jgi:hypothetical protein
VGAASLDDCAPCPPGAFGERPGEACAPCPSGKFGAAAGANRSAQCLPCAAGYFSDAPGAIACKPCGAGQFGLNEGGSSAGVCAPCPPGTFGATQGALACTPCPGGTASAANGATSALQCARCAPGTAAANGSLACVRCPAGTFAAAPGAPDCTPCPANTYSSALGADAAASCVNCPEGAASDPGATSAVFCVLSAAAAAAIAGRAKQADWLQTYVIPIASVVGAIFTYLVVGDRLVGSMFPACHGRAWRGVAHLCAHRAAPTAAALCCCCRASAAAAVEMFAAGILKRLGDMEVERKKAAVAHSKLKLVLQAPAAAAEGAGDAVGSELMVNPLRAARLRGAPKERWARRQDEATGDVWYARGEETVWEVPDGEEVEEEGGAEAGAAAEVAAKAAAHEQPAEWWTRHEDTSDVWYTRGADTVWDLPRGAVWSAHRDEEGDAYFVCEETGETSWCTPDDAVVVVRAGGGGK